MTIDRATEILRTLAEGTDPLTGEILSDDNVCNRAEVVRAFYCILNELEGKKKTPARNLPDNAGKPWTEEDDMKLVKMYDEGCTKKEMMSCFGRTNGAIVSRLMRLGKIDNRNVF